MVPEPCTNSHQILAAESPAPPPAVIVRLVLSPSGPTRSKSGLQSRFVARGTAVQVLRGGNGGSITGSGTEIVPEEGEGVYPSAATLAAESTMAGNRAIATSRLIGFFS
jgi:hypothetical protein